ncbi:MAG: hypothetical protein OXR73_28315 [Myxococcales bacterium]|nr:hypothetical protein [Myxococcales bacterium]
MERGGSLFAWLLGLLGALAAIPAFAQLPAARVEGVAALVGGKAPGPDVGVILRSDVELKARINLARASKDPLGPLTQEALRDALRELIGEELIVREARRIRTVEPGQDDLRDERKRLAESCGGAERLSQLLTGLQVRDQELRAVVQRRALVAAFLTSNLEGATTITEGQIDAALAEAGYAEPGKASPETRRIIAAALAREALNRSVKRWVRVLSARVPVRVYARFDAG